MKIETLIPTKNFALGIVSFLLTPIAVNAQQLPGKDCISTAYSLASVQLNNEDNIEVVNFNSDVKYFSRKSGILLGRAKGYPLNGMKKRKTATTFDISYVQNKKSAVFTARAKEIRNGKDTVTYEKILNVKGDKYDVYFWENGNTGMSFIKTKTNFYFLSPYRIDTLTNGKTATAEYFKNTFNHFHPDHIKSSPLFDENFAALLTSSGTLITAKDGIIAQELPKPLTYTEGREDYLFWENKPYLTYTANRNHAGENIITIDYETGKIIRIVSIPKELIDGFVSFQHSYPTFKPLSDNEFLIFARQHSPNTYIWYFNKGEIIPLCDPASKDEYAGAKKQSDAFYAWERKNYQQQQEAKQQADAKWVRENSVTRSECTACGGKGGTSVENVTSASGVGYRTVYKTNGFGNKTYVTSNYGRTFYRCRQCNGTGVIIKKGN